MDLSVPLSSLAPTLDAEALTVLARARAPLTGRRVAALARRGTAPGMQKALARLVRQGLVEAQPAGSAVLYELNEEHLLAGAVLSAVQARDVFIKRLMTVIADWDRPCVHASLVGSLARGEAGPDSDIDVLAVRPEAVDGEDPTWVGQLANLERTTFRWTGNALAWFETTEADLVRAVSAGVPVVRSWQRDAVRLAGEPLDAVLGRASL